MERALIQKSGSWDSGSYLTPTMGQFPACKGEAPALSFFNSLSFKPSLASICTKSKTQAGTANLGVTDTCQFLPLHFGPLRASLISSQIGHLSVPWIAKLLPASGSLHMMFSLLGCCSLFFMAGPFSYLKFQTKCFLFKEVSLAFFLSDLHPIIFLKKKKKGCEKVYTSSKVHKIIYA